MPVQFCEAQIERFSEVILITKFDNRKTEKITTLKLIQSHRILNQLHCVLFYYTRQLLKKLNFNESNQLQKIAAISLKSRISKQISVCLFAFSFHIQNMPY